MDHKIFLTFHDLEIQMTHYWYTLHTPCNILGPPKTNFKNKRNFRDSCILKSFWQLDLLQFPFFSDIYPSYGIHKYSHVFVTGCKIPNTSNQ